MIFRAFICFDNDGYIKSLCRTKDPECNQECDEYIIKLIKIDKPDKDLQTVTSSFKKINDDLEMLNKELKRIVK